MELIILQIIHRIHLGFDTIRTGFAGFHYVVATWLFEMTVAIFLYYLFQIWGSIRQQLNRNSKSIF